jgi:hypothetical protein
MIAWSCRLMGSSKKGEGTEYEQTECKRPELKFESQVWLTGGEEGRPHPPIMLSLSKVSTHAATPATPLGQLRSWCGWPGEVLRSTALPAACSRRQPLPPRDSGCTTWGPLGCRGNSVAQGHQGVLSQSGGLSESRDGRGKARSQEGHCSSAYRYATCELLVHKPPCAAVRKGQLDLSGASCNGRLGSEAGPTGTRINQM